MNEIRSEATARAILRCTACKRPHLATFTTVCVQRAFNGQPSTTLGVLVDGHMVHYRDRYDLHRIVLRHFTCEGCGHKSCTFDVVKGTLRESVRCDRRCTNAKRAGCECSCAGANHGSDHALVAL